jgi:S1-C subfamily serine protease
MSKRFTLVTVALAAAVAFFVGLIIAGGLTPEPNVSTAERLGPGPDLAKPAGLVGAPMVVNFADVAERINAAVVNIDSTSKATESREPQRYFRRGEGPMEGPGPRDLQTPGHGSGSGFLIDRGGYSRRQNLAMTRWREDMTTDEWGNFCFVRDLDSGLVWSTTHQPVGRDADEF